MIYFLEVEKTGLIKIGYAENVYFRANIWQRVLGNVLIVGIMHGNYQTESGIHRMFSHLRHESVSSELFLPSDELLKFITENTFQTLLSAKFNKLTYKLTLDRSSILTIPDIASFLNITTSKARKMLKNNMFPNAHKERYTGWLIVPIEDVKAIKEKWELEE